MSVQDPARYASPLWNVSNNKEIWVYVDEPLHDLFLRIRKLIIIRIILYTVKIIYDQWRIEYDALYERVLWSVSFYRVNATALVNSKLHLNL